ESTGGFPGLSAGDLASAALRGASFRKRFWRTSCESNVVILTSCVLRRVASSGDFSRRVRTRSARDGTDFSGVAPAAETRSLSWRLIDTDVSARITTREGWKMLRDLRSWGTSATTKSAKSTPIRRPQSQTFQKRCSERVSLRYSQEAVRNRATNARIHPSLASRPNSSVFQKEVQASHSGN